MHVFRLNRAVLRLSAPWNAHAVNRYFILLFVRFKVHMVKSGKKWSKVVDCVELFYMFAME
jgi:hypothetical protein